MSAGHLNRRDLLVAAGVASCAGLVSWVGAAADWPLEDGSITDMTMNAPSYATPIGYGRIEHDLAAIDPMVLAFG